MRTGYLSIVALLLLWPVTVGAQNEPDQQSNPTPDQQEPSPAFGQDQEPGQPRGTLPPEQPGPVYTYPPLTGLDEPSLEPANSVRNFLAPGVNFSQGGRNQSGRVSSAESGAEAISRLFATLALDRSWENYDLNLGYVGGGVYHTSSRHQSGQVHTLSASQTAKWRRGQLRLIDDFSYSPESLFGGGPFGGAGASQALLPGTFPGELNTQGVSPGQFGGFGFSNRINNLVLTELQESLTPRSTVTASLSYGLLHFLNRDGISSHQANAQLGYSHVLNPRNQVGISLGGGGYRFKGFGRPFTTTSILLLYGHQISGRMTLELGAGPQLTKISRSPNQWSWSATSGLQYRFPKTQLGLRFQRYVNNGSGISLGAQSNVVRLDIDRPLGRRWSGDINTGYVHSHAVEILGNVKFGSWYAGTRLSHHFTRYTTGFVSYQFDSRNSNTTLCNALDCAGQTLRHEVTVGISWIPRPWRID